VIHAHDALAQTLANDLSTELAAEVPTGYLLVPGAATTTYRDLSPVAASSTGSANVRVEGDAMAIIFPDTSLAAAIATSTKDFGYSGEALTLLPSSDLQISSIEWPTASDTPFSFVLTGTATLEYTVDPTRIAAAVAGKTRALAETALSNYPEVKRAVLTLRPFWRQAFPQDPSQISVTIVQPQ
jgi:hypothetical protein